MRHQGHSCPPTADSKENPSATAADVATPAAAAAPGIAGAAPAAVIDRFVSSAS